MVASAQFEDRSGFQAVSGWDGNSMGIVKATEGTTFIDPTFAQNWANLKKAGIPRGAYHFFHPGLPVGAQMDHFFSVVTGHGLERGDLMALDQELFSGVAGETHSGDQPLTRMHTELVTSAHPQFVATTSLGATAKLALDGIKGRAAKVAGAGHTPIWLYTFTSMLPDLAACTGYDLWIARPGTIPPGVAPWKTWHAWQYESGGGPGGGDRDAFNGTHDEMMAYFGTFMGTPPPPPPPPGKATQPTAVTASARFTNATLSWSGAKFPAGVSGGFKVDIVDDVTGVHVQPSRELPETATSHKFGGLKFRHKYKLGVYAQPGAPGSHSQWVTTKTR
jgi:hypothetical protein